MCGDNGEITKHEPQTKCQKLMIRVQALVFSALSIYTIISLILALEQVSRTDLQLSDTPPSDRCVPFFDKVKNFKNDNPNTFALYDYRAGEAIVRICTNESSATVRNAIGSQFAYDPWIADTGCDVLGNDKQKFLDNCELVNMQPGDPTTCADVLNVTPLPYGAHWNMYAQLLSPNKTNSTYNGPAPPCSIQVTRITEISPCTLSTMEPLYELNENVAALIKFGVAVPFIVMIFQGIALWSYAKNNWQADEGWKLAFACRGVPGSMYMLFWVCKEGEENRGEFPDTFLNFWGWLACAVQDAMEGLAVPLVAILGCRVDRYPVNLILVILKGLKVLFDLAMYLKNRNEESEPGGQMEQQQCWAASAAREAQEEMQKNPSSPPQQNFNQQPAGQIYPGQQPQYNQGGYPQQQPQYQGGV